MVVINNNVLIWIFYKGFGPEYKSYVNTYNDKYEPFKIVII